MSETFSRVVNIYVESGQAEQAYDKLISRQKDLTNRLSKQKEGSKAFELTKQKLDEVSSAVDRAAKKLNGTLAPSYRDLQATVGRLRRELQGLSEQDAGFEAKRKEYNNARAALDKYSSSLTTVKQGLKEMLKEAKGIAVGVLIGNTVQAAAQAVGSAFSGFVGGAAKVSDEMTDIEKTTNLTTKAVRELNGEITKTDTRTGNSILRKYAADAGKAGKDSIESVKKFVVEANQIYTALGEDLGEDAITNISKVADIFETSMLKIGSAINTVGQSSNASERWQQEFLFRLAGTAKQLKILPDQLLGYGAAIDINGGQVEASSTAIQGFLIDFVKNAAPFEKAAGMVKGSLSTMISEKGVNAAFLEFIKNMKAANPSDNGFLAAMEKVGIDGTRGANTFLTLANNIGLVEQQQAIANKAFAEGSSITEEYNKRNNNFAATIDKIKKQWGAITASKTVQEFLNNGALGTLNFLRALKMLPEYIKENSTSFILLTSALVLYNAEKLRAKLLDEAGIATKIKDITVTKGKAIIDGVATAAQKLYGDITAITTAKITLADKATRLWSLSVRTFGGWLGILATALAAVGIYLLKYKENTDAIAKNNRVLVDSSQAMVDNMYAEREAMNEQFEVLKKGNLSQEARKAIIDDINARYAKYLPNLLSEKDAINDIAKAQAEANKQILAKGILEAYNDEVAALRDQSIAARREKVVAERELVEISNRTAQQNIQLYGGASEAIERSAQLNTVKKNAESTISFLEQKKTQVKAIFNDMLKETGKDIDSLLSSQQPSGIDNIVIDTTQQTESEKSEAKKREDSLKRLEEFHQKMLNLKRESEAALLSEDEKEQAEIETKFREHLAELAKLREDEHLKEVVDIKRWQQEEELIRQDFSQRFEELNKKQFLRRSENEYEASLFASQQHFERQKEQLVNNYENGLLSEREYQLALGLLNSNAINAKITIAKDYSETVKKAATDTLKFQDDLYKQDVMNARRAAEQKKKESQFLLETQLGTAQRQQNKPVEYNIRLTMLAEQYAEEMALHGTSEEAKTAITQKYKSLREELDKEEADFSIKTVTGKIQTYLSYGQQVIGIFENIARVQSNIENAQIEKEKRANSQRIKSYDAMLEAKRITQEEHDKLVGDANIKMRKREDEISKRQFERNKAFQIANATMNTAAAVVGALSQFGTLSYGAIALAAIAAASGAAEIAVIASEEYTPPSYGDGHPGLSGDKHSDPSGGNYVVDPRTGRVIAQVERGEAIIPADATAKNPQIIKNLLTVGRKKSLMDTIRPVRPINYERNLENIQYANGGRFQASRSRERETVPSDTLSSGESQSQMQENNALLRQATRLLRGIYEKDTSISLKEMYRKSNDYEKILTRNG